MKLSKTEEELMNHLWEAEKCLHEKIYIEVYSRTKPAATTILRCWADAGFKNCLDIDL